MSEKEILDNLNIIFRDIFDDGSIVITRQTIADDIEDWDSLEHINVINTVEKKFKVRFSMKDVAYMKNIGDMVDIILSKKNS